MNYILVLLLATASTVYSFEESGLPWIPFGFYQYTVTKPWDFNTTTDEASNGMNLVSPYVSTAAPDDAWFESMQRFMDRAHDTGFKIHFQLIAFEKLGNDNETMANLTKIVNTFKNHKALFSWYLADEPDGQGIPLSMLQPKYDLIKSLDPYHDVSMVFCAAGELNYLSAFDIVMVDPYPVPNSPVAPTIMASMELSRLANKSIILVPQSFGGGEGWARTPTAVEERLMTYLGLIHGATGIQYFVRDPPNAFPYAAYAWNEIRKLSMEIFELTPALLNRRLNEFNRTNEDDAVQIGVWLDRDESIVIVAANQNDTTVSFDLNLTLGTQYESIATLPFENFVKINLTNRDLLHDTVRPFGTSVYRIEKVQHDTEDDVTNLVYNGGYEINGNPGVPDGAYVSICDVDAASTFFADPRVSKAGRHSLVLRSPSSNCGVGFSPYRLSASLKTTSKYQFSVWVRGDVGGEIVRFTFSSSIFVGGGTIDAKASSSGDWTQYTHTFESAINGTASGWVHYEMITQGRMWVDELSMTEIVGK